MAPGTVFSDDLENYGVDDFGVDPFAESGDDNAKKADAQHKKKDALGLGIDEAVAVSKKVRAPRVKLDDKKLLSVKGIPKLRKRAGDLKFKGKGHEFSDTARLLSFYQLWLDDLYPKAKFLDALAMVEKAGHTKSMRLARMDWINEGKPKDPLHEDEDDDLFDVADERETSKFPARVAPIFQNGGRPNEKQSTPSVDDLFGEEDLYNATPRASRNTVTSQSANGQSGDAPDEEEDLDALMAEEEAQRAAPTSIFGNGQVPSKPTWRPSELEDDDMDALMAEAESRSSKPPPTTSKPRQETKDDDQDDLDALIAEAEAQGTVPALGDSAGTTQDPKAGPLTEGVDADEEEAMAEMDGLW